VIRDYEEHNTALTTRKADLIKQREDELAQLYVAYKEAGRSISGRVDGKELIDLARLMKTYQAGDSPEKAVYVLAQATMLVNKMVIPFLVVANYENKERELDKLRK
jgi:hypothetical protein